MSADNVILGLADFFSYEYQCKLIRDAQLLDADYENAIIEYAKFFMANLIKCMYADIDRGKNPDQVKLIDSFIGSTSYIHIEPCVFYPNDKKKENPLEEIEVSPITEFFLQIRKVYHC